MKHRILIAFAVLTSGLPLQAQGTQERLPVDDPRLFRMFLHFHDGVTSAIEARFGQSAQAAAREQKAFAGKLQVRQDELAKLKAIARSLDADLKAWQAGLKSHVDVVRGQKQQPTEAALSQFDRQKAQLLDAAVLRMQRELTPESWAGLRAFVNGEYRNRVHVVTMKQAKK